MFRHIRISYLYILMSFCDFSGNKTFKKTYAVIFSFLFFLREVFPSIASLTFQIICPQCYFKELNKTETRSRLALFSISNVLLLAETSFIPYTYIFAKSALLNLSSPFSDNADTLYEEKEFLQIFREDDNIPCLKI